MLSYHIHMEHIQVDICWDPILDWDGRLTYLMGENHFRVMNEEKLYFVFDFWNLFLKLSPGRKI